ncbi:DNA polymerase III subunit alpha [Aquipuribacter nitratireducens]|uniref:DNA polymerase III subunit alpha n=1 Tax=Aquipuribacter nitratireducens TaxID=650104 RepID=A0ABW0GQM0_9MICO
MPSTPTFTHLHVASGYSLRHGAATPAALVARAAEHGMDALALTDRDGCYGAVKFAGACAEAGIDPLLGVDLAVEPTGALAGLPVWADPAGRVQGPGQGAARRRTPVRGGAQVDPRHPRITVLALAADPATGLPAAAGWARVCRLVSATHARGERGRPVATEDLLVAHSRDPGTGAPALAVLLGPHSEVGRAVLARRDDLAVRLLRGWAARLPPGSLFVEVVHHRAPRDVPASLGHAARMLAVADAAGVPAVLTNAVRHVEPGGGLTVDVLDAARRLVRLDPRHLDRTTSAGYLAGAGEMTARAREVADLAAGLPGSRDGSGARTATRLLATTAALADRCRLDPAADLSVGSVHLPEAEVLGHDATTDLQAVLAARCREGLDRAYGGRGVPTPTGHASPADIEARLADELAVVEQLGFAGYFLTVAEVCDLTRSLGVRVAARGSGAGSLVCHVLGVSGVDPVRYGLLMERFLSPLRASLPDVDVDVESARRKEVYDAVLARFGADRVTCVSMMDTYRVRHAVRDVGAALGMPPTEVDAIATSFPHIRARDARKAIEELPELRASGLGSADLDAFFDLVESVDGLPRHIALHPCGVVLSDAGLLDRTPVEPSHEGYPMTQLDKDDVEEVGLLKLDVLGIRMQSAMAHAVAEVARVDGEHVDVDDRTQVPLDDDDTYALIRSTRTLGCFQIESPGQRELVGKFAPETFEDVITDISLFRPGPVKSDMVTPFLRARQGWNAPEYLHPDLEPVLAETYGVVVFHEQVIRIVAVTTGCTLAEADEVRRAMGSTDGQAAVREWYVPTAVRRGYDPDTVSRFWEVLKAFASFGFCKAHAAAFALPTYQSAWLKRHHPAAFLAGVLTHDPGMYPKRLVLDDARQLGIAVLGLDVNASDGTYRVERVAPWDEPPPGVLGAPPREAPPEGLPDARGYGIRLSLADVKGISDAEVERVVAGRPYGSLADFWHRAGVSRPVAERLVVAGAFDELYGLTGRVHRPGPGGGAGYAVPTRRRGRVTRRDLLLQVAELDRWSRAVGGARGGGARRRRTAGTTAGHMAEHEAPPAAQLALDLGDAPDETVGTDLPDMTSAERVVAELDVLGLDASRHVLDFYTPLLDALGVTRSPDLVRQRSRSELLVAGVKVATQTPPIRSGRRVVFLTLDDATGAVDATFFEDVQGPYAATVFHSWLLLVRGVLRRTGPRGVSLRATGAWELPVLWQAWKDDGLEAVRAVLDTVPAGFDLEAGELGGAVAGAAASRSSRPVMVRPPVGTMASTVSPPSGTGPGRDDGLENAGGMGGSRRRVLVHASGFTQSPYADIRPAGVSGREPRKLAEEAARAQRERGSGSAPRRLWHASPGSSGR